MSRSNRLLRLMQSLRRMPSPVTARSLAEEMEVSERSIYRDIQSLRESGAIIDGEAGFGYTLTEDPALPPMQFEADEIEALALGLKSVAELNNLELSHAAQNALVKVEASVPEAMRGRLRHATVGTFVYKRQLNSNVDLTRLREAIWEEQALQIDYVDLKDQQTQRKIWPLTIYFFDRVQTIIAWCCMREDFRMFRLDRVKNMEFLDESFRPKRVGLLRDYFQLMSDESCE